MAREYGSEDYAGTVVGLEHVNEPFVPGSDNLGKIQQWVQDAYKDVKAATANPNLMIVMHDALEGPNRWTYFRPKEFFIVVTHLYQLYTDVGKALDQAGHTSKAGGWVKDLRSAMPPYPPSLANGALRLGSTSALMVAQWLALVVIH